MTRPAPQELQAALSDVAAALALPGQPGASFQALDRALGASLGHKLFTLLRYHPDSGESERVYSNQPEAYPIGGRKPLNPTFWTEQVLRDQRPYIGHGAGDIEAVFFDHALIASLGCESVLNLPVVFDGRTLGTINLLHAARWYRERDIPAGTLFAALAVPAYLSLGG